MVTGTVTSATRRHGVVPGIIAAVILAGLGVVLAPMAESASPYDGQARAAIRSMRVALTPQALQAAADATATPTPRVIVIQRTPTPSPVATATAPPNRAALPTATPQVITIETPAATGNTPTPTATTAPTIPPPPTATPLPTATPTATPLPTATPSPTPDAVPTLAPARDILLQFTAEDWVGGYYRGDSQFYGRPWVAVYGALSDYPRATLGFTLDATPGRAATISITGLDDEWQSLNPVALEVNGQAVYTGPSPFVNWDGVGNGENASWTTVPFTIPSGMLRAGPNEIAFANLAPVASFNSPPYVLLADAILEISVRATGDMPTPTSPTTVPIVPSTSGAAFTAADWIGAFNRGDEQFYGRPWSAIYGAASEYPRATIRFRLDAQPSGPATLVMTGLDDELPELNPIAIEVNGQQVFSGPSPFLNWDGVGNGDEAAWTEVTLTIPADVLKRGRNEITIANLSPGGNFNAPPYLLLADATLEAPGATVTPLGPDENRRQRDRAGGDNEGDD
jgi:hypothetical protein